MTQADAFLGAGRNGVQGTSLTAATSLWEADMGRSLLLLFLGVPIPIIILLALVWH
jgi:hypothetical protein